MYIQFFTKNMFVKILTHFVAIITNYADKRKNGRRHKLFVLKTVP